MTKIQCNNQYVPDKIRAHPFYFYELPVYLTFFTIIYWVVVCPLLYSQILFYADYGIDWVVPFFILSLTFYVIIICIFLCIWRCKRRRKGDANEGELQSRIESFKLPMPTKKQKNQYLFPLKKQKSSKKKGCSCNQIDCNMCSAVKYNFIDVLPQNKIYEIQKPSTVQENQYFMADVPKSDSPENCEYFMANIPSPNTCVSEVFLFVGDTTSKQESIQAIVHLED